jgi:hypothetical protein
METALAKQAARQKVGYRDDLEARVATSYDTNYPDSFGDSPKAQVFAANMKTYEDWKDAGVRAGVAYMLRNALEDESTSITESINMELGDPELNTLASGMLAKSVSFVHEWIRFLEEYHAEMASSSGMSKDEAWKLTKALVGEVLRDLRLGRNGVRTSRQSDPLNHIWGAVKAHGVMRKYVGHHFKDHPALGGIQTRHFLKRRLDANNLEKLTAMQATSQAKINAITQKLNMVEKKVDKKADK